jgi:aquaporin Z
VSELLGTGIMMANGVAAIALCWAPGSPLPQLFPSEHLRLLLTGLLFASGATLVIYSPLGQRSGGHLNPAVTLAFWILGKISGVDAIGYGLSQTMGAVAGVLVAGWLVGAPARSIRDGLTLPGPGYSLATAFAAEVGITFLLVLLILVFVDIPRIARFTGVAAGMLVALLVAVEAPVSGTSLNPARSFAPALVTATFSDLWIYLLAPPLGAAIAAGTFRSRLLAHHPPFCAKLYHSRKHRCIFSGCGYRLLDPGKSAARPGHPAQPA